MPGGWRQGFLLVDLSARRTQFAHTPHLGREGPLLLPLGVAGGDRCHWSPHGGAQPTCASVPGHGLSGLASFVREQAAPECRRPEAAQAAQVFSLEAAHCLPGGLLE